MTETTMPEASPTTVTPSSQPYQPSSTTVLIIQRLTKLIQVLNATSTALQMHVDTLRTQNINPNLVNIWLSETIPSLVMNRLSAAIDDLTKPQ